MKLPVLIALILSSAIAWGQNERSPKGCNCNGDSGKSNPNELYGEWILERYKTHEGDSLDPYQEENGRMGLFFNKDSVLRVNGNPNICREGSYEVRGKGCLRIKSLGGCTLVGNNHTNEEEFFLLVNNAKCYRVKGEELELLLRKNEHGVKWMYFRKG